MPRISPFVGLRYDPQRVGPLQRVTTPPYDLISREDRHRYLQASPHTIARLDLAEGRPGEDPGKYTRAGSLLGTWRAEGVLVADPRPAYYPYEMRFRWHGEARRVRGLICEVELEPWGRRIVPHERTMAGAVEDRLELLRATRANLSCVYGVVPGPLPSFGRALEGAMAGPPVAEVEDEEGVQHRLWRLEDGGIAELLEDQPFMIADGHHRYTTALRFRDEMRASRGPGPWDRAMALVVDGATERPPVLPYHRVVVSGAAPGVGDRVRDLEEVLAELSDEGLIFGSATREGDEVVHRVGQLVGPPPTVCALHRQLLGGLSEDALRFTQDAIAAEQAVREGRALAAYFLPATTPERIRTVVQRGERLPEKSTFFWPKPRTGMVVRVLE